MSLAALVLQVVAATTAAATPETLVAAVRAGSTEDVARIARRLGPASLAALLDGADDERRRAALLAAPALDDAWTLLPRITARLDDPQAASAAAAIARRLAADPLLADRVQVEEDVRRTAAMACGQAAARTTLPAATRADAVECAIDLGDAEAAFRHVSDAEAEVRVAAIARLAAVAGERERTTLRVAALDSVAEVSARAFAGLCARDPRGAMVELPPETRARLREVAVDKSVDRGLRPALRACLRASPDPADRAVARKR